MFFSGHQRGKGGVALLISPCWIEKLVSHNYSPYHRAIWAIVKINYSIVGICNIYVANDYRERATLWDSLVDNLPEAKWIIMGDFSMMENNQDKKGVSNYGWKGNEQFFWNKFKRKFQVQDPLEKKKNDFEGIWYTR